MKLKHLILLSVICCSQSVFGQKANQQPKTSGNPVFPGWYADPAFLFAARFPGCTQKSNKSTINLLFFISIII